MTLRPAAGCCLLALGFCLSGCSHYADFTLPLAPGGDPAMTLAFDPLPEPVIARGDGWASGDVLNPSVVREAGGLVNYYSGFDGHTWHTGRATSSDGVHWQKTGKILSPNPATWEGSYIAANGAALAWQGRVLYWYVAGPKAHPQIGLEGRVALPTGPYLSWDEIGVSDPYVVRIEPYFYLYYTGLDRGSRQRLGVARSSDGAHWEKLRSNPILAPGDPGSFDENGLGEPAVWQSDGWYWMLFTGRDSAENRRLGLARSRDGVRWTKLPTVFQGSQAWDSKVMCDPTVLVEGGAIRVWFGGGDVASPDENLHGQIGYGNVATHKCYAAAVRVDIAEIRPLGWDSNVMYRPTRLVTARSYGPYEIQSQIGYGTLRPVSATLQQ